MSQTSPKKVSCLSVMEMPQYAMSKLKKIT